AETIRKILVLIQHRGSAWYSSTFIDNIDPILRSFGAPKIQGNGNLAEDIKVHALKMLQVVDTDGSLETESRIHLRTLDAAYNASGIYNTSPRRMLEFSRGMGKQAAMCFMMDAQLDLIFRFFKVKEDDY